MVKSNSIIGSTIADDGNSIVFTVKGCDAFTFDLGRVNEILRNRAELHGWVQRISDGGALSRDPTTGKPATPEDKRARMLSIAEHYMAGGVEWGMKKAGGGKKAFNVGAIIVAMIRAGLANDPDEANILISKLATKRDIPRDDAAKLWANTKDVIAAMAAIEAEKAPEGADDLLAELDEEDVEDDAE